MIFSVVRPPLLTLALALFALMAATWTASAQSIRTAATVNDEVITNLDIQARTNLALAGSGATADQATRNALRGQILDLLITEALQRQEAQRLGINISAERVEETLVGIATRNGGSINQFVAQLESQGALVSTLRNQIASQLAWQGVIGRRFFSRDVVSDADVAAERVALQQNANRQERLLSEIYIPFFDQASQARAVSTMNRIRGQVENGTNFGILAQQFSQAPSALDGGDLGWVREGTLEPTLERALAAVEEGGISPVITVPGGVYFFGVRGIRPVGQRVTGQQARLLQLFFALPEDLEDVTAQQKLARAAAIIQSVEGCEQFSTAISRFGEQGSGDMGTVNLSDLPSDLARVAGAIDLGRVTPPYPVPNGAALFMVCSREDVSSPVTEQEIRDRLLEQRLSGRATKLLRELRRQAFIDIRG